MATASNFASAESILSNTGIIFLRLKSPDEKEVQQGCEYDYSALPMVFIIES